VSAAGGDEARAAAVARARVKMLDRTRNVFRPGSVTISRGDRVVWVNRGDVTHTATGARWDSGAVAPGERYRRRFRHVGTFPYRCVIHPEMTGTIIVVR
jgi:plastocyanin